MSYQFVADRNHRMPTHFGPLPGPRQHPDGGYRPDDQTQRATSVWASFAADRDEIAALLPEGFTPSSSADVTVEVKNMTNIGWLAGRGYSVVTITTGVALDDTEGRFKLVLWENLADPIITGREELGYPKIYGEIPEIEITGDGAHALAAWDGFTFAELDLVWDDAAPSTPPAGPSWHLKYMPRVSSLGRADTAQVILTPPGQGPLSVTERRPATATARFTSATFEQLPTFFPVANALAALHLGPCLGAGLARTVGTTDLRDQIIVSELT
jgi:hypothetical protein